MPSGDQPGLRAVVQVPFDAAQFGGLDVEDVGAGSCEVFDAADEFGGVRGGQQASAPACVESQGGGGQFESRGDGCEAEQERGEHRRGGVDRDEGVPVAVAQEPPDEGLDGRAEEAVLDEGQAARRRAVRLSTAPPRPSAGRARTLVAEEGAGLPVAAGGVPGWAERGGSGCGGLITVPVQRAAQSR